MAATISSVFENYLKVRKIKIYDCLIHCNMKLSDLDIVRQVGDSACGNDVLNCPMPELQVNEFLSDVDISFDSNELNIILYVSAYIVLFSVNGICLLVFMTCAAMIEFCYHSEFLNICNRARKLEISNSVFFLFFVSTCTKSFAACAQMNLYLANVCHMLRLLTLLSFILLSRCLLPEWP